jgi:excisionase family DNA binding protein
MSHKLLTIDDLSDYLGVPKGTLYQWRSKGYGPSGIRMGKYVRYRPEDVDAWLDQQVVA